LLQLHISLSNVLARLYDQVKDALAQAKLTPQEIDALAYTKGTLPAPPPAVPHGHARKG
jgi:DNA-binding MarR family transcriptional regulator